MKIREISYECERFSDDEVDMICSIKCFGGNPGSEKTIFFDAAIGIDPRECEDTIFGCRHLETYAEDVLWLAMKKLTRYMLEEYRNGIRRRA